MNNSQIQSQDHHTRNVFVAIGLAVIVLGGIVWWLFKTKSSTTTYAEPIKGTVDAPVRIVDYSDFECPACRKMYNFLKQAEANFGDKVSIEYRDFPLTAIHPNAMIGAEAAQCALVQNKFWEYHDILFERQDQWSPERDPKSKLIGYAQELGLAVGQFQSCLDNNQQRDAVKQDMRAGDDLGINSTPTLYINGERYGGVSTYDSLAKVIQQQLDKNTNS